MIEIVRSEDHTPPHVHIINRAERWEVWMAFSFICDRVYLYRIEFEQNGKPSGKELKKMAQSVQKNRAMWRNEWLRKNPYVGFSYSKKQVFTDTNGNHFIRVDDDSLPKVKKEEFKNEEVVLTLSNGTIIRIKPDTGSKEDFPNE